MANVFYKVASSSSLHDRGSHTITGPPDHFVNWQDAERLMTERAKDAQFRGRDARDFTCPQQRELEVIPLPPQPCAKSGSRDGDEAGQNFQRSLLNEE